MKRKTTEKVKENGKNVEKAFRLEVTDDNGVIPVESLNEGDYIEVVGMLDHYVMKSEGRPSQYGVNLTFKSIHQINKVEHVRRVKVDGYISGTDGVVQVMEISPRKIVRK
jgi:hypothetical protein